MLVSFSRDFDSASSLFAFESSASMILIVSFSRLFSEWRFSTSSQDVFNACLVDSRSWISSSSSLAASHEHKLRRSGAGIEAGLE